ncbi:hypothetical protein STCU_05780 [Strigomonas culicis]|uniref:Uncharacterized protein n=1 Tax=Strigomonas culicis TaxID=28005 RepID=S9VVK1_9TRYP|nr:hypothetical protein STCU_05780 [Strigomonas culicis]|eukprot:EPY27380.1 hypothetical protein STCU_05780 [Strigomonas culicis]
MIQAMDAMVSKKDIFETFSLSSSLANSEPLDVSMARALSSSLLRGHLVEQVGEPLYQELLAEAVGSTEDRWQDVSVEEKRIFSLYHVKRLERYYEKGTSFNPLLGFGVEGSDNEMVTLTEARLRRQSERAVLPVTSDVLADLMHLDVSWTVALRLLTYAKEVHPSHIDPPTELRDRVTGLMTGYRSNGLGSRPWEEALRLYAQSVSNGYDTSLTTHTHALDALWRSGDTFHKVHQTLDKGHQEWVWNALLQVRRRAKEENLSIRGDEGCAYMESLVKGAATAGRWEAAVALLSDMDTTEAETSHRLLVPTAESFVFAMIACHVARNAVFSASLRSLFKLTYTWQSVHSEVLLHYVQSLRHVVRLAPWVGEAVEEIMSKGRLDRLCAVACLQLLSSQHVHTAADKVQLALKCFDSFDANSWSQQPLVRKIELQTVFRCCYIIESRATDGCTLMSQLMSYFVTIFGKDSPEVEWIHDTEVYKLQELTDCNAASDIFRRQITDRPPGRVKFLPMPVRQVRYMYRQVLLRCARRCLDRREGGEFFLDDDTFAEDSEEILSVVQMCVDHAKTLDVEDFASPEVMGELLLIQSLCSTSGEEKKKLAVRATLFCH